MYVYLVFKEVVWQDLKLIDYYWWITQWDKKTNFTFLWISLHRMHVYALLVEISIAGFLMVHSNINEQAMG